MEVFKLKFCIDAGHNYDKFDTGSTGNGLREQDVTFKIAQKLESLLKSAGLQTLMTRKSITENVGTDSKSAINERYKIANSEKADYFVSIHCNAGGGTGTETLIYAKGGKAEILAGNVQSAIVKKLGTKDRGIKVRGDIGVLKYTDMPAILVETAFIDNSADALLLKNNTDGFAQAIFEGIKAFAGIKEEPLIEEPEEIIDKISEMIEINDKKSAVSALAVAKKENSSLYWILYKLANK